MQKISLFHLLSFWDTFIFRVPWPCPPNTFLISYWIFFESVSTSKKSVYSICSFFRHSQFSSPAKWLAISIFDHANQKNFQTPFNLLEVVPARKNSVNSIGLFLRHSQKNLYGPFLWMRFNCLKACATSRRQFTFYYQVPRSPWYSFDQPQKDERLSWPWRHSVVLNTGPQDWESWALTTSPETRLAIPIFDHA